jgi:hypothetical protein
MLRGKDLIICSIHLLNSSAQWLPVDLRSLTHPTKLQSYIRSLVGESRGDNSAEQPYDTQVLVNIFGG